MRGRRRRASKDKSRANKTTILWAAGEERAKGDVVLLESRRNVDVDG